MFLTETGYSLAEIVGTVKEQASIPTYSYCELSCKKLSTHILFYVLSYTIPLVPHCLFLGVKTRRKPSECIPLCSPEI